MIIWHGKWNFDDEGYSQYRIIRRSGDGYFVEVFNQDDKVWRGDKAWEVGDMNIRMKMSDWYGMTRNYDRLELLP